MLRPVRLGGVWRHGLVAVALLATVFAGVRVFRPTDTLDVAHGRYPAPAPATDRFYGELLAAPLIVDDRIRVYAAANRVWADGPVDAKMTTSAYWAFRRWPAVLVGVVVAGDRVVSRWSDGEVVAQRPDTGAVLWRASVGARTRVYEGRRTGAKTVYDPPDLATATAPDGQPVVVATGVDEVTGLDADSGAVRWRHRTSGEQRCAQVFTGPGIVVSVGCQPSTVDVWDAGTGAARTWPDLPGAVTPVGCAVGRSQCTGVVGAGHGWVIGPAGTLTAAAGLTDRGDRLSGDTVVRVEGGDVVTYDAVSGARRWSRPADDAVVLAVEPGVVHLLTPDHHVVSLELGTGDERSRIYAHIPDTHDLPWVAGYAYASDGYVVIERLIPGGNPNGSDAEYYYQVPTLVLTGS